MKNPTLKKILSLTALATGAAWLLTGCSTTAGYKQADKTGAGIAECRDEVVKAKKAIDETVAALDQVAVTATTNPRKAFEQYSKQVDSLESAVAKAKKRGQDMREQGQAYFKQWEKELAEVKNEDIRKLAVERKAKLQETFDNIKKVAEPLKAQIDPWLSDLRDLKKYLSADLTIAGVDAAKPMFAKVNAEGIEVQKSMDAFVAELNTVAATLTPAKVQSPK